MQMTHARFRPARSLKQTQISVQITEIFRCRIFRRSLTRTGQAPRLRVRGSLTKAPLNFGAHLFQRGSPGWDEGHSACFDRQIWIGATDLRQDEERVSTDRSPGALHCRCRGPGETAGQGLGPIQREAIGMSPSSMAPPPGDGVGQPFEKMRRSSTNSRSERRLDGRAPRRHDRKGRRDVRAGSPRLRYRCVRAGPTQTAGMVS